MILVTVGTHSAGFNRLVKAADDYAKEIDERVVIQYGVSTHEPDHAEHFDFTDFDTMNALTREARAVVMHAAAGAILLGLQMGKPLVLVPRRKKYTEVIDDHQLELTRALCKNNRAVECKPVTAEGLATAIELAVGKATKPAGPGMLVNNLRQYLGKINMGL